MDPLLWLALAIIVAIVLFSIPYVQNLLTGKKPADTRQDNNNDEAVVMGGARRRPRGVVNRDDGSDGDGDGDDEISKSEVNVKKIGTKKQKKLAEKAEKKAQREQMEALRADEKKREAARQEELKKKEIEEENQRQKREQEEKARKERLEREEHEKYLKLKSTFIIEDEGDIQNGNDEKTLQEFIDYIKATKVVLMEELAAEFDMRTQDVIDRLQGMLESGRLTGVFDDRGKFIYITMQELQNVAKFIKQRGRVSITELARSSNNLINLQQ